MKIKNIYIAGLLFFFLLVSCQKYLDLAPENNTYDEVFWRDANNISKATAGGYSLLRNALRKDRSYFIFGDVAGGNFKPGADYWNYSSFQKTGGFVFSYTPYLEGALRNWTRFYEIINQCNLIIENTPNIPASNFSDGESEKNYFLAQAHFLRAYTNFYMLRVWGDILLVKESYKDAKNIPPLARASKGDAINFCIEDLKYAIDNLEVGASKAFASKGSSQALLAHVYAWNHDFINAELLATEVVNSGNYSLESIDNYLNIWKGQSKETILELPMLYSESGEEFNKDFFNVFLAVPYIKDKELKSAWLIDDYVLENYFDKAEQRLNLIKNDDKLLLKYSDVKYYEPNDKTLYTVSNNLVLLRLADIYLLRAEAYFNNKKELLALADLNRIRTRAGLTSISSSGDNLFLEIFRERRRELIGEGSTQFDLIRMNLLDKLEEFSVYYSVDRINRQGYYWPLDMRALLPQDELLTQNPWWQNN